MNADNAMATYEHWRRAVVDDPVYVREMDDIQGDPEQIRSRFGDELRFGTAGMRGVLGVGTNRMNSYTVRRATRGLAEYILQYGEPDGSRSAAERGVVIAYDSRRMSEQFAGEAARVLAASGVRALLFPSLRPVPVLSFAVRHLGACAGIVITASHNPAKFNGYKAYWEDGAQMPPERADAAYAMIQRFAYEDCRPMPEGDARARGLLETVGSDVDDAYIERVKTLSIRPELLRTRGAALKMVYTPLHGAGYVPVCRVLAEMGVTGLLVVAEQKEPDGDFPTIRDPEKGPNPEEAAAYELAIRLANEHGADVCLATDPDCDRLGVSVRNPDGNGFTQLTGNQIGCLLLHYILSSRAARGDLPGGGFVVKSIVSTELARDIADAYGVRIIDTLTGFKFIAEQIELAERENAAGRAPRREFLFGFEESYGFLSSTFVRDKDAVNAALLFTELVAGLSERGQTVWDRMEEIQRTRKYVEDVASIALDEVTGPAKVAAIMGRLRDPARAPKEIGGVPVAATRDYMARVRTTADGTRAPIDLPTSDVVFFELEGGHWVCVRPSGTEPKIKIYINTCAGTRDEARALAKRIGDDVGQWVETPVGISNEIPLCRDIFEFAPEKEKTQ